MVDAIDPFPLIDENGTTLYVHVLSMKRGDSILLMIPDEENGNLEYKNILIDLGEANIIEIKTYLRHFNALNLNALIISHPHSDHAYRINIFYEDNDITIGDIWLTEFFSKISAPISYTKFIESFKQSHERLKSFFKSTDHELKYKCNGEEISVKLEWPSNNFRDNFMRRNTGGGLGFWGFKNKKLNPNDSSLAISISYAKYTFFTTGDMTEIAWKEFDKDISCQGYKLSHHVSPNAKPSNRFSIKRLDPNWNATFAIATEGPNENYEGESMPTNTVITDLHSHYDDFYSPPKEDHVGEVYSILKDRKEAEAKNLIQPISYIFAITPSSDSEKIGRFNFVRYFSITEEQAISNRLKPQDGRDYYTEDITHPIKRV